MIHIRPATQDDIDSINVINNYYIEQTHYTFDMESWSYEKRYGWLQLFLTPDNPYHLLVAEDSDAGLLMGYTCNTPFRPKAAYHSTTEVTIYTNPDHTAQGIGSQLYDQLFKLIAQTSLHRGYAVIALPNEGSIAFHKRYGFHPVGVLNEVGQKFGQYIDTAWYEKYL